MVADCGAALMTALMPGAVGAYACLCTDAAATLDELPAECPGHRKPLTGSYPNPMPGGVAAGHECFTERPCPRPTAPPDLGGREASESDETEEVPA